MARVYVGNLPIDIRERELDDLFYKYGRIKDIDLKMPSRPPAFAFIAFEDYRDAEDAVKGRDGYSFDGQRLRCEMAKGDRGGGARGGRDDRSRGATGGRRTEYGVVVSNLPKSCSWQDLKDYMRRAGDVVFSDVNSGTGEGVVEFSNREDMENAIRKLDDTEFRNHNDSAYIRVKSAKGGRGDSRDRKENSSKRRDDSRSRSRSRSRSYSPDEKRDRKKAASPSRSRSSDRGGDDERKDGPSGASRGRSGSRGEGDDDVLKKEPADAEADGKKSPGDADDEDATRED